MSKSTEIIIELKNIVKMFGPIVANNDVNLSINRGEIHAIVGENGAGKSTLMNILYGLYHPDEGEIIIKGEKINKNSPKNSIKHGIGMVHQHFMLIPTLTVCENVILGMEPKRGFFIDTKEASQKITKLSADFNLKIESERRVCELSVGENQRVEIIKVLYRGAEILILDEPTAVLTPKEVKDLFKILRSLVLQGKSVIIITHKLDEVMEISDRITVMKQGKTVGEVATKETNKEEIARMMVGRDVLLSVKKEESKAGDMILSVKNLNVAKNEQVLALSDVTFDIKGGEILGICGVEGNGQSELIESIMGLNSDKIKSGKIEFLGNEISRKTTRERLEAGISHIPEDRHLRGLVLPYKIKENLIMGLLGEFTKMGFLNDMKIDAHANKKINEFDIRPASSEIEISGLSGGNQQKVIIAREFSRFFNLLIAAQPTRGVDIGAIEFIHSQILDARKKQKAILLISSELSEIISLSDRIAVLYKGKIVKILDQSKTDENELGILMTGAANG